MLPKNRQGSNPHLGRYHVCCYEIENIASDIQRTDVMGRGTRSRFSAILQKNITFMTSSLLSCTPDPFGNGVYPKRVEFEPQLKWKEFFPFRVDLY